MMMKCTTHNRHIRFPSVASRARSALEPRRTSRATRSAQTARRDERRCGFISSTSTSLSGGSRVRPKARLRTLEFATGRLALVAVLAETLLAYFFFLEPLYWPFLRSFS
jgi:hypothetical protein